VRNKYFSQDTAIFRPGRRLQKQDLQPAGLLNFNQSRGSEMRF
jgi:hypothetical protein